MDLNSKILSIKKADFHLLFKNCIRKNTIFGVEFKSLIYSPYWLVAKELPELINANEFELAILKLCESKGHGIRVVKLELPEVLPFLFYVLDELNTLALLEQEYLASPPDNDLLNAGVKDLDELGVLNVVDALAGGDILKWDDIKALPYFQVFDKLRKNNLDAKIQKRYAAIQREKNKTKKR
jgi:hypothetical protein